MRRLVSGLVVLLSIGCDASSTPLAEREALADAQAPGGPSSIASACGSAVKPAANLGTMRVKARGYTADHYSVRFFLEPKGAGKAPFEVVAGSQNLSNLLISAFDAQREVEVAVKPGACVPEVVFIRSP